jgi:RimJ/RimL family protein N-acetyltransferase
VVRELRPPEYERVRPLFLELGEFNATLAALLDGRSPGRVLADDSVAPASAFALTVEGCFLAGDPTDRAFVEELNDHLVTDEFNDEPTVAGGGIFLRVHPQEWRDRIPALFRPREPMELVGRHYVLTELRYRDWRDRLPEDFHVRRVDASLLDDRAVSLPRRIAEHIEVNWGARERYLEDGFGLCAMRGDVITHWSMADCATKDGRCEIGIWSLPEYRRRGLAAITTAASVEHALSGGFVRVGWQCRDDNVASRKTAERVGFVHERTVTSHYCMLSSVHQEAECGWYHLRNGRHRESAAAYERLLALEVDLPAYIHHTAARAFAATGRAERALLCLRAAQARGWADIDFTSNRCPEFEPLRGTREWEAIFRPRPGGDS